VLLGLYIYSYDRYSCYLYSISFNFLSSDHHRQLNKKCNCWWWKLLWNVLYNSSYTLTITRWDDSTYSTDYYPRSMAYTLWLLTGNLQFNTWITLTFSIVFPVIYIIEINNCRHYIWELSSYGLETCSCLL